MPMQEHVYVAMSGGVDSAVTAARLKDAGYRVTGIHMETWKDPKMAQETKFTPVWSAKTTAAALGIPFVSLDISEIFYERVVQRFIDQYRLGQTPNPCLFCNPQVKWGVLQSYALDHGANYFATGHYARIMPGNTGRIRLLRAIDRTKDQVYVLSMLLQQQLCHTLLPLGEMTKNDVRKYAQDLALPVADRPDSQDLCFLANGDYRDFLQRFGGAPFEPGEIVNLEGEVIGAHHGLAFYTIGQRKGIRVASSEPYYVFAKDIAENQLVVGYANQIGRNQLSAGAANWILETPPQVGETYDVMIRYRAQPAPAVLVSATKEDFRLKFKQPLRGITPGQVAVLFSGEECLGGGIIQNSAWS